MKNLTITALLVALTIAAASSSASAATTFPNPLTTTIAPHVQSGAIQLYSCTQVGFSAATCSQKAVPSSTELAAFIKFVDKEASLGYHFLGASANLGFTNVVANPGNYTSIEYFVFEAP